jgi:hypothetical protein
MPGRTDEVHAPAGQKSPRMTEWVPFFEGTPDSEVGWVRS